MKRRRVAPIEPPDLAGGLWELVIPLGVGATIGAAAIVILRAAGLRFTWALCGAPVAYLAWVVNWQIGLACTTATVVASGAGLHWHQEDLKRGGEEAGRARAAKGPLHAARTWAAQRRLAEQGRVKPAERRRLGGEREARIALGLERRGGVRHVPLGLGRGVHALVLGATGAGKTVTQAAILQAHVLAGLGAIVIDPKGDRYLRGVLVDAAERRGVAFREWSPTGAAVYNPFARGGPTEITDKLLAGQRWSEPHYELATQRLLLHVLTTMRAADRWPPALSQIVHHMDPDRLDGLACEVGGDHAERVSSYVDGLSARGRADLGGGRDRLAVLAEGELGPRLDPALGEGEQIDLAASLRDGAVVYFHLDADRYPAASKLLAAALVIDLVTLAADMQRADYGGIVAIDEFAALAADQVSRLFGRARSAELSILLGTQSLADLRAARPEEGSDTLTEQVLTNVAYLVVHREADPDSAERLAKVAGTQPSWSVTEKAGGRAEGWIAGREGTRTREREFIVLPDQFKRLRTGEAVLLLPNAKTPGEVVRILAPQNQGQRG
ncbi:MAG TPA: type IV secretion system DNA-binding domain-containing protein [Solirubrobacterales bacterium]|jgi:type IV secretory pathway TraG/TraD family ATPase VirD4|nr:type IV secretion system DNA-binding domain-containing protein [Solirubrobacterales bacterium]